MIADSAKPILLVLRHHGLGDLVTVQPALRSLRIHFPNHHLVTTCPSWLLPLARHYCCADQFVTEFPADPPSHGQQSDPARHQQVDGAILANAQAEIHSVDVLVSLRTPGSELIPLIEASSPRLLVSYQYSELESTHRYPMLDFTDHILERWRRLLSSIEIDVTEHDIHATLDPPTSLTGFTVVHVGAGSNARLWPVERWVRVVRYLESTGHRVVLTGSPSEAPRVRQVCDLAGLHEDRDRAGNTEILELAALVAGARLVVCVDTGISHLATAFKTPAVTLFGPVPPAWWGPPPGNPQHRTLWAGKSGEPYADVEDPGLLEISVAQVCRAIDELNEI